jgi:hypothetical protein
LLAKELVTSNREIMIATLHATITIHFNVLNGIALGA